MLWESSTDTDFVVLAVINRPRKLFRRDNSKLDKPPQYFGKVDHTDHVNLVEVSHSS